MATVLRALDANISYGKRVPRAELLKCEKVYRGTLCTHSDLSTPEVVDSESSMFFGTKAFPSAKEAEKELIKKEIREELRLELLQEMKFQRELLENEIKQRELLENEMKQQGQQQREHLDTQDQRIEKAGEQQREHFKKQDRKINKQDQRIEEFGEQHQEYAERVQEMGEYIRLETTPRMICSGVIGGFQLRVEREFQSIATSLCSQARYSEGVKALKNFLGEQKELASWSIAEMCYRFAKKSREQTGNSSSAAAAAADFLKFIVDQSMQRITSTSLTSQLDEDPKWIEEWAAFKAMVYRRHQGGHPDVEHEETPEEPGRVARTRRLYEKLVRSPGSGCGDYEDFTVQEFINLARLALEKPAKSVKLLLEPCNVWIGGSSRRLEDLLGSGFQTSSHSYLIVRDLWHADVAAVYLSASWRDDVRKCLSKGVEKIVAIVESKEHSDRKLLLDLDKSNYRCTIQIRCTSEDDAELYATVLEALGKMKLSRPSKKKSFLMVAVDVKLGQEQESSGVIVDGRVERGSIKAGMELVFEGQDAIKFQVTGFRVHHSGADPVPGAWVSVTLSGPAALSSPPTPGQLLADSWKPERSRSELQARVANVSSVDFISGAYQLECSSSGMEFDVEVELKWKLQLVEEETTEGETKKKRQNPKKLAEVVTGALRRRETGVVKITSQAPMPLLQRQENTSGGNYECCRFIITSGSVILLTGQTLA